MYRRVPPLYLCTFKKLPRKRQFGRRCRPHLRRPSLGSGRAPDNQHPRRYKRSARSLRPLARPPRSVGTQICPGPVPKWSVSAPDKCSWANASGACSRSSSTISTSLNGRDSAVKLSTSYWRHSVRLSYLNYKLFQATFLIDYRSDTAPATKRGQNRSRAGLEVHL
jgi:hypothetical protein